MKTLCLSYKLNNELSCYNNEKNIQILPCKLNEKRINMFLHSGTHIDFPAHVLKDGKTINNYSIEDFIYDNPYVLNVETQKSYIEISDLKDIPNNVDFLIFKINKIDRTSDEYALNNTGISNEVASFLRQNFRNLRAVGINSISVNAYQDKESGRLAHKTLLGEKPEILIIEDMYLENIIEETILRVIVAPLFVDGADGVPVTILAEVK